MVRTVNLPCTPGWKLCTEQSCAECADKRCQITGSPRLALQCFTVLHSASHCFTVPDLLHSVPCADPADKSLWKPLLGSRYSTLLLTSYTNAVKMCYGIKFVRACLCACAFCFFSYASSSTLYPCQWVSGWAEFRTSVASRLASLFSLVPP